MGLAGYQPLSTTLGTKKFLYIMTQNWSYIWQPKRSSLLSCSRFAGRTNFASSRMVLQGTTCLQPPICIKPYRRNGLLSISSDWSVQLHVHRQEQCTFISLIIVVLIWHTIAYWMIRSMQHYIVYFMGMTKAIAGSILPCKPKSSEHVPHPWCRSYSKSKCLE